MTFSGFVKLILKWAGAIYQSFPSITEAFDTELKSMCLLINIQGTTLQQFFLAVTAILYREKLNNTVIKALLGSNKALLSWRQFW